MIELRIKMLDNGEITVNGPIRDKLLSYGLLEMAKQIITNYQESNLVIPKITVKNGN